MNADYPTGKDVKARSHPTENGAAWWHRPGTGLRTTDPPKDNALGV